MDTIGTRLGILCVALTIPLSACGGPETAAPDLRTPPARDAPARDAPTTSGGLGGLGGLAGDGAAAVVETSATG